MKPGHNLLGDNLLKSNRNYDPTKLAILILSTAGNDQTGYDSNNTEGNVEDYIADVTSFSRKPVVSIQVNVECIGANKSSICGILWAFLVISPGTILEGTTAGLDADVTNGKDSVTKGNKGPGIFILVHFAGVTKL